ncbi:MAG: hypothetical protein J6T26_10325 [Firmicutes bacterium]|nr:hypothetical protein [Bacillota bacterium]
MAELILPLARTLFLPGGCPGLGSVEAVSGDLRDVRCGSSEGEAYCMGEADILVEYTAPLRPAGLFGEECGRPGSWQALLSFPFQLCGAGELPRDRACRVELGPLDWTMVASRAIELETTVRISYDLPEEEGPEQTGLEPAATAAEDGVIYRGRREKERESEGKWQMVSLKDEGGREKPLEIIDLSGEAEPQKIRQALADALARQEEDGAEEEPATGGEEYRISLLPGEEGQTPAEDGTIEEPRAEQEERAEQECLTEALPAEEGQCEVSPPPEKEEHIAAAVLSPDGPAHEDADPTPLPNAPDFAPDLPLPVPVSVPEAEPAEPEEALIETAAVSAEAPAAELLPEIPPEVPPAPRPKRRFRGLPGLHVEAYDNDIDVTAFHISIKL